MNTVNLWLRCPHLVSRLPAPRGRLGLVDGGRRYPALPSARGLKHRADKETRVVPIPPELIQLLHWHIATFGVAADGRLFRSQTGGVIGATTTTRVWAKACQLALSPAQCLSVLARRPYDLRHAALSLWLNAGVPATNVAQRAGQSVEVLLKIYAKCLDGDDGIMNGRIEAVLE
jgi:integrase